MFGALVCMSSAFCQAPSPVTAPVTLATPHTEASITASETWAHTRTVVLGSLTGTLYFNDSEARTQPLFGEMTTNNPSNHYFENGRLWITTPRIGPEPTPRTRNWMEPGPQAYGAPDDDNTMIYVLNGSYLVSISPWQRLDNPRLAHLEAQRNRWLYERGYVGGVRTFVNDAYLDRWMGQFQAASGAGSAMLPPADDVLTQGEPSDVRVPAGQIQTQIQPRGVLTIPPDMPRFRKRMDVRQHMPCGVPTIVVAAQELQGVRTVTGRGNSWTLTVVQPKPQDVASAKPEEPAADADGV